MFTDINIYPINNKTDHISRKKIIIEKKSKQVKIFSILGRIWSRIRIHINMKRIRNTAKKNNYIDLYSSFMDIFSPFFLQKS